MAIKSGKNALFTETVDYNDGRSTDVSGCGFINYNA